MMQNGTPLEPDALDVGQAPSAGFLSILWQRKSLILLGTVLGVVLGALYYVQRRPSYQASAQILVVKKRPEALPLAGGTVGLGRFEDYVSTHLAILKSPLLVGQAVAQGKLQALPSFAGQADPAGPIIAALTVGRDTTGGAGSSDVINLSFRGPVAEDCPLVVKALITSYQEFLKETYKSANEEARDALLHQVEELQKEMTKTEKDHLQFRERTPHHLVKGPDGGSAQQTRLAAIEAERSALSLQRAKLQSRLSALDAGLKEKRSREELTAMIAAWTRQAQGDDAKKGPAALPSVDEQLLPLLLEEKTLLVDYGPDHPRVRAVRDKIQMTRAVLARAPEGSAGDSVETYADLLRHQIRDTERSEEALTALLTRELEQARKQADFELRDVHYRNDLARTQQSYDIRLKQLDGLSVVKDIGGFDARVLAEPRPGIQIEPKAANVFPVAVLLGLVLGIGLAYLAELSDKSFRSPEDIRRRLGLPVVGHVPVIVPGGGADGLDPMLCSHHRPQSAEAEAYRGVRTALYFSVGGKDHKVIQITSPGLGDGKTTLAANLAVSMAQSGKRTLLIDADFRRPRQHKVFGLTADVGLASVIGGDVELAAAVQPTGMANLWLLPCGPRPFNPAELLTQPRLKELLDATRAQYDFILIDTPPLLAVSDPSIVAPRVDGVLLTMQLSRTARPQAVRAHEILDGLGAKTLGVVVNRAGRRQGRYSYAYGYQDAYAYHYHDGSAPEDDAGAATGPEGNGAASTGRHREARTTHRGLLRRLLGRG
jgi:capsular exopolysaccharide synthesis family protein